jgi:hypothetical protein
LISRPTTWFLALYTAAPNDAGGGTQVTGSGYSRQSITFAAGVSPGGTMASNNAQTFTASGGNWGSITHIGIFDASTSGNLLWHGPMTTPRTINDGDQLVFASGAVNLTLA